MLSALSAAATGMRSSVRLLDGAAARVSRATAAAPGLTAGTPSPSAAAAPVDELLEAVPDLLTARTLMAAQVFTAHRADEAYRSALDL